MNQKQLKKLPLGISDFRKIIEGGYSYVDKTQLIYKLVTECKYYLFSRPRHFGKTLLVSTLTELFSGNKELFKDLWIDKSDYDWPVHPIIRLDLSLIDYSSVNRLENGLIKQLHAIAEKYHVVIKQTESAQSFFYDLIQALAKINSVVILIDNYDKPVFDYVHDPVQANARRKLLINFYVTIKGADGFLHFVFLSGVTKFSQTSIFSGLNNLLDISMYERYATILGYTEDEIIDNFSDYLAHQVPTHGKDVAAVIKNMKHYYGGYLFADEAMRVFDPFSVLSCLEKKRWENYWFEASEPDFLIKLLKTGNYPLDRVYAACVSEHELNVYEPENLEITLLLYQTGYLTISKRCQETICSTFYKLDFPNYEVARAFNLFVARSFTQLPYNKIRLYAEHITQALEKQDLKELVNVLQSFFNEMPIDVHISCEFDLQIIIFSVFKLIGIEVDPKIAKCSDVPIEVVCADWREADLVVTLPEHIYVTELKFNKSAQDALQQIQDRRYYEKYTNAGKPITLVGIGFDQPTKTISLVHAAVPSVTAHPTI